MEEDCVIYQWKPRVVNHKNKQMELVVQKRIVFESGSPCPTCGGELYGSSEGEPISCTICHRHFEYMLCSFCEHGISIDLLEHTGASCCLIGRKGGVWYCQDFVRGAPFGEDKSRDIGKRRNKAEKIFSAILFKTCHNCKHYNTDDIVVIFSAAGKLIKGLKLEGLGSYSGKHPLYVGQDLSKAYCEIHKSCQKHVRCKYFKPESRSNETRFKRQQKRIQKYLKEARLLEAHVQSSLVVI